MGLRIGNTEPSKIYLGSSEVSKIYFGSVLVWDKTGGATFLYDTYPAFFGISSARTLKAGITDILRGRISSGTEQDFTATETSDGTIVTFSAGGDVSVPKPYDQSGNSYVVKQTTAADQPLIVDGGALITSGGEPAFDNTNGQGWKSSSDMTLSDATEFWFFFAADFKKTSSNQWIFDNRDASSNEVGRFQIIFTNQNKLVIGKSNGSTFDSYVYALSDGKKLLSIKAQSNQSTNWASMYIDGVLQTPTTTPTSANTATFLDKRASVLRAGFTSNSPFTSKAQEFHLYKGDQSSNRAAIEDNIGVYYDMKLEDDQLLDTYSGAAAAYSLRDLNKGWKQYLVRVRRSSDNTERDFKSFEITDGTLTTFVGASGDGFVTKWYDQSGNSKDAVQTTSNHQPQIVNSGSLLNINGKPSVRFGTGGIKKLILDSVVTGTTDRSFFITNKVNAAGGNGKSCLISLSDGINTDGKAYRISRESADLRLRVTGSSGFSYPSGQSALDHNVLTNIWTSGGSQDAEFWTNGVSASYSSGTSGSLDTTDTGSHYIGWYDAVNVPDADVSIQEMIIYTSDESTNRVGIETNTNNYYGAY